VKRLLWVLVSGLLAAPAWAQSPYVAGAIGAEIVRSTSVTSSGSTFSTGNGESWSGAMRLGTLVASRVGVELEWLWPGLIESNGQGPIYIAGGLPSAAVGSLFQAGLIPDAAIFPIVSQQTRMRTTTLSTLAFVRQPVGEHVDLVYLGGLGFSRVVHEISYGIPALPAADRLVIQPYRTRTTQYGVGPVVGAEARIGMTGHLHLVAGVRLHALGQSLVDGWLVRPSVGLAWMF
jgi:hypothetical protein